MAPEARPERREECSRQAEEERRSAVETRRGARKKRRDQERAAAERQLEYAELGVGGGWGDKSDVR